MEQRMEQFELLRATDTPNEWKEDEPKWRVVKTIRAAVSTSSGRSQEENQLTRVASSQIAVTWDTEPRTGDRLRSAAGESPEVCCKIVYIAEGRRMRAMRMEKEQPEGTETI